MCNLYSLTKGQAAIRKATRAMVDRTGNLPLMPGIFPDYAAPIVVAELPRHVGAVILPHHHGR